MISKLAESSNHFRHYYYHFNTARDAFQYLLLKLKKTHKKILLPAYIGFSTREGSGVFDPIRNSKIDFSFYHLDQKLNIDLIDLKNKFEKNKNSIFLIIHYFGFRDQNYEKVRKMAKKNNIIVIEDYAHGLYTFYNNKITSFDYVFFSLHKMLPLKNGGVLVSNNEMDLNENSHFLTYDFKAISEKRIKNYKILKLELSKIKTNDFIFLKSSIGENIPQTFPLIMSSEELRDHIYFELNKKGYGVVSLYHELISEIDTNFINEKYVSKHILNLPLHQDTDEAQIIQMVKALKKEIKNFKKK